MAIVVIVGIILASLWYCVNEERCWVNDNKCLVNNNELRGTIHCYGRAAGIDRSLQEFQGCTTGSQWV